MSDIKPAYCANTNPIITVSNDRREWCCKSHSVEEIDKMAATIMDKYWEAFEKLSKE